MIGVDEARTFVLSRLSPLPPIDCAIDDALDRVAAATVRAREATPRFDNSAMDGFALRAGDTASGATRLRIVDAVFAGATSSRTVGKGEASRIMTGAPLPPGADSVCQREDTLVEPDGHHVLIQRVVREGESVRRVGEDVLVGQTLVEPGDVIGPALLGALAGQGIRSLLVHPTPRVGVLSTGDEISDAASPLAPGRIRDANRPALIASLRQSGFSPVDLGRVGDSKEALRCAFERATRECDAVVSTGGVSAGDADFVKVVLGELFGDTARSMQVAMRPGKPFAYAYDEATATPFFALAGNPVSTLVGFELFVRPALRRLGGHRDLERARWPMVLDCDVARSRDGKLHLLHAVCYLHGDGRLHVRRVARTGSHLLFAVADANCLLLSPESDGLVAGDIVQGVILDESRVTSNREPKDPVTGRVHTAGSDVGLATP